MFLLGQISVPSGVARSNVATGASFGLPPNCKEVYLQADTSGVQWEMLASPSRGASAMGAFLPGPNVLAGPYRIGPMSPGLVSISVFNPVGGTVKVRIFVVPR